MHTKRATSSQPRSRYVGLLIALFSITVTALACSDPAVKKQKYLESGNRYFDKGQYAEAIVEYRNAIGIDATFGEARKRLAESYTRAGSDRAALDEFIRAADLLPTDVALQVHTGNLLLVVRKP